jgi:chromosome segregation ATPase
MKLGLIIGLSITAIILIVYANISPPYNLVNGEYSERDSLKLNTQQKQEQTNEINNNAKEIQKSGQAESFTLRFGRNEISFHKMNFTTLFNIVFILMAGIILFLIMIFNNFRKQIKLYQKNNLDLQTKYLEEFSGNLSKALANHRSELKKITRENHDFIKDQKDLYQEYLNNQTQQFKNFIKKVELEFNQYKNNIYKSNQDLNKLFDKLEDNIKQHKDLFPVLENNYTALERISDKTKEIISDHEKRIKDQDEKLKDLLDNMYQKSEDTIKQLQSSNEKEVRKELNDTKTNIEELLNNAKQILNNISNNSKQELNSVANIGKEKINELNHSSILNLNKDIQQLEEQISQVITMNNKIYKELQKTINNRLDSIDSTLNKKRGLFR